MVLEKKEKGPGIHLNGFDKIPLELAFIIGFFIVGIGASCFIAINSELESRYFQWSNHWRTYYLFSRYVITRNSC